MVHIRRFLKIYSLKFCDIWLEFYLYRILNNENFKMKVEQTNFVTHLIIKILEETLNAELGEVNKWTLSNFLFINKRNCYQPYSDHYLIVL